MTSYLDQIVPIAIGQCSKILVDSDNINNVLNFDHHIRAECVNNNEINILYYADPSGCTEAFRISTITTDDLGSGKGTGIVNDFNCDSNATDNYAVLNMNEQVATCVQNASLYVATDVCFNYINGTANAQCIKDGDFLIAYLYYYQDTACLNLDTRRNDTFTNTCEFWTGTIFSQVKYFVFCFFVCFLVSVYDQFKKYKLPFHSY